MAMSAERSIPELDEAARGPAWMRDIEPLGDRTSWQAHLRLPPCERPMDDFDRIVLRGLDDVAPFGATAEELARKTALASDFVLSRLRKLESDRRVHEQAHVGGTIWRILPDGQAALGDNGIDRQDACPTVRLEGDEGGGRAA